MKPKELDIAHGAQALCALRPASRPSWGSLLCSAAAARIIRRNALEYRGRSVATRPSRSDIRIKASIEPESAVEWGLLEM